MIHELNVRDRAGGDPGQTAGSGAATRLRPEQRAAVGEDEVCSSRGGAPIGPATTDAPITNSCLLDVGRDVGVARRVAER